MRDVLSCIPQSIELVHPSADPLLVLQVAEDEVPVRFPIGVTKANVLISALTLSEVEHGSVYTAVGAMLKQQGARNISVCLTELSAGEEPIAAVLYYDVGSQKIKVPFEVADGIVLAVTQNISLVITVSAAVLLGWTAQVIERRVDRQA